MTPEERVAMGRRAAAARWSLPRATHAGVLQIGDLALPCSVLTTGERVLSQIGFYSAVTGSTSVSGRAKTDGGELPVFLAAKNLRPFISAELAAAVNSRVLFLPKNPGLARGGGNVVHGIPAALVPQICDVWLRARAADALYQNQEHIAARAEVLMRGLALVGIIALVDEATGYQVDRRRDELSKLLEAFIAEQLRPYVRLFPHEFFEHVHRLWGWPYTEGSTHGPRHVGNIINECVYARLRPEVLDELRRKNPSVNGRRKHKHTQWLTEDVGIPTVDRLVNGVVTLLAVSDDWAMFQALLKKRYPAAGDQLSLSAVDVPRLGDGTP